MASLFERWHFESIALYLAHRPHPNVFDKAIAQGMNPRLIEGIKAAQDAFANIVNENDAPELFAQMKREIEEGLTELDNADR